MKEIFDDINKADPLKRLVERETEQTELSPMDPPDAYAPPVMENIAYEEMHPVLQRLMDEHKNCLKELEALEETLLQIQKEGMSVERNKKLGAFFSFLDQTIVAHNLKEEKILFPSFHQKLLENGIHSHGPAATTGVDMLEDDHVKLMQLSAVAFNFFSLAGRLPDIASRAMVLDAAVEQGKALVEMLQLHIFREDNVVFAQAQQYVAKDELDDMLQRFEAFKK